MGRPSATTIPQITPLTPSVGAAPAWIELLPAAREVVGRDGRRWLLDDPQSVAARSLDGVREIPIDWEHAGEIKAPQGEPAPAAGWITALEVRGGGIWGKVEWTPRGFAAVEGREYRYISPVFEHLQDTGRIVKLLSAALTNSPNLRLRALNREILPRAREGYKEKTMEMKKEKDMAAEGAMTCPKEICEALGAGEDTTIADAVQMIAALRGEQPAAQTPAMNRQAPSLDKYVPRGDYDAACSRARNAETKLAGIRAEALDREIETALAGALEAGKITPATEDYHRAQCRLDGGLARFARYVESAPEIAAASMLGQRPKSAAKTAGDSEQRRIAAMFGNSDADLAKYNA